MSSKRAKRHQLIVRVSNGNRTTNKQCGFKVCDVMLMPFLKPKQRFQNLQSEFRRIYRREHPYTNYKQHKTEMIRFAVWTLEPEKGWGRLNEHQTSKTASVDCT